ncbi:LacI family DNA-binding transcriptional regulator [Phyllobacterium sp. SB3]|uniref:LacI family DNA-binding transcriptional regulator n=1 Tax=Phyllobacterium sp. SB3 TaxID=3156073 RepID=UPI0032AEC0E6
MSNADRQTVNESKVVKLKDVALRAGCSIATASRVLNGNPTVGQSEKERVLAAAAQLGYTPNTSARALRSQSTHLVGVIIPTLDHAIYAKMVDALQERLAQSGTSVIINTSGYDLERESKQAKLLVSRGVEAIVLVGSEHNAEMLAYLRRAGVSQLFTYTCDFGDGDAAVGFNNRIAGASAASFLLGLGHRRFGMIAGITRGNDRATQRREGYLDTLAEAGIDRQSVVVIEAPYMIEHGRAAMQSLMQTHPRPSAVFCGSDILAVGGIKYCRSANIGIPDDISVVGFDNLEIAELISPELTTLDVPAREMGEAAAEVLLQLNAKKEVNTVTELRTRLIVRGSTGPAG